VSYFSIAPDVTLVDITHHIPPPSQAGLRQNIRQAAYVLHAAVPYFPAGTIHLACGGSQRRQRPARALPSGSHKDSSSARIMAVFTLFLVEQPEAECRAVIHQNTCCRASVPLFHGRDVFAPSPPTWPVGRHGRIWARA